jgi:hypothetical protein
VVRPAGRYLRLGGRSEPDDCRPRHAC